MSRIIKRRQQKLAVETEARRAASLHQHPPQHTPQHPPQSQFQRQPQQPRISHDRNPNHRRSQSQHQHRSGQLYDDHRETRHAHRDDIQGRQTSGSAPLQGRPPLRSNDLYAVESSADFVNAPRSFTYGTSTATLGRNGQTQRSQSQADSRPEFTITRDVSRSPRAVNRRSRYKSVDDITAYKNSSRSREDLNSYITDRPLNGFSNEKESNNENSFNRDSDLRKSMPIVKSVNKSREKTMGVVFLRFAGLSRHAQLPNEVTSMDTVKALFVRSFPDGLSLSWFDRNDSMVFLRQAAGDNFVKLRDFRLIQDKCILEIRTRVMVPVRTASGGDKENIHTEVKTLKPIDGNNTRINCMENKLESLANWVEKTVATQAKHHQRAKSNQQIAEKKTCCRCSRLPELHKEARDIKNQIQDLRKSQINNSILRKSIIQDTFNSIKTAMSRFPDSKNILIRNKKIQIFSEKHEYTEQSQKINDDLNNLDSSIEFIKEDIISKKCKVNIGDVESFAVNLSSISKDLAELKDRFPELKHALKYIMQFDLEQTIETERFLKDEPSQINDSLKICKKLSNTLYTLKKLSMAQEEHKSEPAVIYIAPETSHREMRANVLEDIKSLLPDHQHRLLSINDAMTVNDRFHKIRNQSESRKLLMQLQGARCSLKQTDNLKRAEERERKTLRQIYTDYNSGIGHIDKQPMTSSMIISPSSQEKYDNAPSPPPRISSKINVKNYATYQMESKASAFNKISDESSSESSQDSQLGRYPIYRR